MRMSESIKNIAGALALIQAKAENVTKNTDNPFYKTKYADLAEVLNMLRPLLSSHGIAIVQSPQWEDGHIVVRTLLLHESGEWIETECGLPVEKMTPQGAGSAITYGRRYSLTAALGIAQEDDDGNGASRGADAPKQPEPPKQSEPIAANPFMKRMSAATDSLNATMASALFTGAERETAMAMMKNLDREGPKNTAQLTEKNAAYMESVAKQWRDKLDKKAEEAAK